MGLEGAAEEAGEFSGGTRVGVREAAEVGADDFGGRVKKAVVADVEPEGAVVPWSVGKRGIFGRGYFETLGDVDAVNDGRAVDVGGGRLFVAVAASDCRDEAKSGEALVEFAVKEVFVGIFTCISIC